MMPGFLANTDKLLKADSLNLFTGSWVLGIILLLISPLWFPLLVLALDIATFHDSIALVFMRSINTVRSGLYLSTIMVVVAFFIDGMVRFCQSRSFRILTNHPRLSLFIEAVLFFLIILQLTHYFSMPYRLPFSTIATLVFYLSFPLVGIGVNKSRDNLRQCLLISTSYLICVSIALLLFSVELSRLGLGPGIQVLLNGESELKFIVWMIGPLVLFGIGLFSAARLIDRFISENNSFSLTTGRLLVGLIGFPLLSLGFFSSQNIPISPQATLLLKTRSLYDAKIDSIDRQLIVTQAQKGSFLEDLGYAVGFSFNLDNLDQPARVLRLPTYDMEVIALDEKRREIYHANRKTAEINVINIDSYKVVRKGLLNQSCEGGFQHEVMGSIKRLFIVCEYGMLFVIDQDTLQTIKKIDLGGEGGTIRVDEQNGVIYTNYDMAGVIEARDPKSMEVTSSVKGPLVAVRVPTLGPNQKLYLPAPFESEIWVLARPDLKLLDKIPTQFGVRALAVDETHNLLLAASFITGYIDVIDLKTGKKIQQHYLGKFARQLAVDPVKRHAFLTTENSGLFLLNY